MRSSIGSIHVYEVSCFYYGGIGELLIVLNNHKALINRVPEND